MSDEIVEAFLLDKRVCAARDVRCSGIRRFIPSIVTKELKMPPSAGRAANAGGLPTEKEELKPNTKN